MSEQAYTNKINLINVLHWVGDFLLLDVDHSDDPVVEEVNSQVNPGQNHACVCGHVVLDTQQVHRDTEDVEPHIWDIVDQHDHSPHREVVHGI